MPLAEAQVYAGNWCVSEINNGGFLQLFWNSTGMLVPEAVGCFRAVGALDIAETLESAMSFFGLSYPRERLDRMKILGGPNLEYPEESPFDAQDERFYEWFETPGNDWGTLADRQFRS